MGALCLLVVQEMEKLSEALLRCFALALDLPENWFEDKIDRHRCAVRALYVLSGGLFSVVYKFSIDLPVAWSLMRRWSKAERSSGRQID